MSPLAKETLAPSLANSSFVIKINLKKSCYRGANNELLSLKSNNFVELNQGRRKLPKTASQRLENQRAKLWHMAPQIVDPDSIH